MTLNRDKLKNRIIRARGTIGRGTRYRLGRGGFIPDTSVPWDANHRCDCSGFISWVLRISRHQEFMHKPWSKTIPWIETTAIYSDARGKQQLFKQISEPVPGCLVVYPDRIGQGHVALVATCRVENGKVKALGIIDCSSRRGEAINERDGMFMLSLTKRGIFCVLREDYTL